MVSYPFRGVMVGHRCHWRCRRIGMVSYPCSRLMMWQRHRGLEWQGVVAGQVGYRLMGDAWCYLGWALHEGASRLLPRERQLLLLKLSLHQLIQQLLAHQVLLDGQVCLQVIQSLGPARGRGWGHGQQRHAKACQSKPPRPARSQREKVPLHCSLPIQSCREGSEPFASPEYPGHRPWGGSQLFQCLLRRLADVGIQVVAVRRHLGDRGRVAAVAQANEGPVEHPFVGGGLLVQQGHEDIDTLPGPPLGRSTAMYGSMPSSSSPDTA